MLGKQSNSHALKHNDINGNHGLTKNCDYSTITRKESVKKKGGNINLPLIPTIGANDCVELTKTKLKQKAQLCSRALAQYARGPRFSSPYFLFPQWRMGMDCAGV